MKKKLYILILVASLMILLVVPMTTSQLLAKDVTTTVIEERHGLFNHYVVLNITNTGTKDQNFNLNLTLSDLSKGALNYNAYYRQVTPVIWMTDVHEKNESTAYNCIDEFGKKTTCYEYDIVRRERKDTEKISWFPIPLKYSFETYMESNKLLLQKSRESIIRIEWNTQSTKNKEGYMTYGRWKVNPDGHFNSSYFFRRRINITSNSSNILLTNFTVNLTIPKEVTGNTSPSGNDLIVVWNNSGNQVEIARINTTPFTDSTTDIWFRLQEDIAAGTTDGNYFIYYNSTNPALPLNATSQIFSRLPEMNETGCVAGYTFREGSGTVVQDTCGGLTGNLVGDPKWTNNTGPIDNTSYDIDGDYALDLDGIVDHVDPSFPSNFPTGNSPITVLAWINHSSSKQNEFIMTAGSTGNFKSHNIYPDQPSKCLGKFGYSGAGSGVGSCSNHNISDSQWHHVVFMYNGSNVNFYVDGQESLNLSQDDSPFTLNVGTGIFHIGGHLTLAAGRSFNGTMDELLVYDRVLTQEEVRFHYWRRAYQQNRWKTTLGSSEIEFIPNAQIVYVDPTPADASAIQDEITQNVTITTNDVLLNISLNLYQNEILISQFNGTTSQLNFTFKNLAVGTYEINATVQTSFVLNKTETRTISIIKPLAQRLCNDVQWPDQECLVIQKLDPDCSAATYNILNVSINTTSLNVVETDNMNVFSGNHYWFNFNQPEGDYIIEFCDNTTRQIRSRVYSTARLVDGGLVFQPGLGRAQT